MKLRHLQYFVALAEELNMRVAASKMHISQPPMSRQIRELEKDLGVFLFDRKRRKLQLTKAGENFLNDARDILIKCQTAAQRMKAVDLGTTGSLSIAYKVPIEGMLPASVLRKCREAFPSTTLIIKEMPLPDQITALLENRIDVGYIGFRNLDLQDILNYETILKSEIFVILPSGHRLLKKRRLDLAELSREKFIFVERQSSPLAYDWLVSIPKIGGFTPQVVQKADTPRNLFSLIAAGVGISLVPEFLKIYALPGVAFRPLKQKVQLEWSMAWRKDNKSPVLETFLLLLRDELKNRR